MRLIAGCRLVFGLLGLTAVVVGFVERVIAAGFNVVSYFSYFTILSNILAAILLLYGVRARDSARYDLLRCAAAVYMIITGLVYAILLSGYPVHAAWINAVEHQVMPVVVALEWIIAPPERRIPVRRALVVLVFPLAYIVYSEVRGAIVGWYPYPFLDPRIGGAGRVAVYGLIIGVAFVITTVVVALLTSRGRKTTPTSP